LTVLTDFCEEQVKGIDLNYVVLDVVGCLRRDGNKIVINKVENEVTQDSSVSGVSDTANDFDVSIVTDYDIRKQNVDFRKDIKDDEIIEPNDVNVVTDNTRLVGIGEVCNQAGKDYDLKSSESSKVEANCVMRVDKPTKVENKNKSLLILDEFVDNDERETLGDEVTTNKMVEIKMGMDGFCKERDKGIKMWITKCMRNTKDVVYVHKNVVDVKGAVEEKSSFSYQNTTIVHGRKEKELKYMRLQKELKYKRGIEQHGKKMTSKNDKIDSNKRYETCKLNKLTKVEEEYNGEQDESKEGNNFVGSDFVLGENKMVKRMELVIAIRSLTIGNGLVGKRLVEYIAKLRTRNGNLIYGDGPKGRKKGGIVRRMD
nr:hypothetical protein [Tanacetum cinerariifolium]